MSKRDDQKRKQALKKRRQQAARSNRSSASSAATSAAGSAAATRSDVSVRWQDALQHHRRGDLSAAKERYCEILRLNPTHPDAWHMLGMVLFQGGDTATALDCLRHAQEFAPDGPPAELLSNLGLVLRAQGNLDEACQMLQRAVALNPSSADSWNNLGTVLLELHAHPEAEEAFRRTLQLQADHHHALTNLGTALQHQRRYHEAQGCHEAALERAPQNVSALNNLGAVLQAQRKPEEAAAVFQRAIELKPDQEEAVVNLGRSLDAAGQRDAAIELLERFVGQHPRSATALHHLGNVLCDAGRYDEGMSRYAQALEIAPEYAHAYGSLGRARLNRGETQAATQLFRRALELRPDLHETHSNLLFVLSNDDTVSPCHLFNDHVQWGRRHGKVSFQFTHETRSRDPQRRLRIGYVSPDLREHAVARFIEPVLTHHDPVCCEVYCYAQVHQEDDTSRSLKSMVHQWRSTCGLSYLQVAEMIYEDEIDVLVDLAGHTAGNRLLSFAYKPAPVQVSWLGYPNTTGLPAIDYRLTSEIQDPSGAESLHTEQLVRLPFGTNCYAAPANAPAVETSPGIRKGYVTFGSLHRPQKISSAVFDLWAAVMQTVATAQLRLFNTNFTPEMTQFVTSQLVGRGVNANRFSIGSAITGEHYLSEYNEIDIALDVFPWNGGTTTREAMWMGVPVIGLLGDRRSSRGTAATLHYSGAAELIAKTPEEYVKLAAALAGDAERLSRYRTSFRAQLTATICNGARFTQSLEAAYRDLWRTWCEGPPRHSTSEHPRSIDTVQTDMAPPGIQSVTIP